MHHIYYSARNEPPKTTTVSQFLVVLLGAGCMVGQLVHQFRDWANYPTYLALESTAVPVSSVPFPSVTIFQVRSCHTFNFPTESSTEDPAFSSPPGWRRSSVCRGLGIPREAAGPDALRGRGLGGANGLREGLRRRYPSGIDRRLRGGHAGTLGSEDQPRGGVSESLS